MARRSRSILIDATLGKIFVNTNANTPTDPSKLIAGTKLASNTVSAKAKTPVYVVKNLSGRTKGIPFITGGLAVEVNLSLRVAATGSPVIIKIKIGSTYDSATVQANLSLPANTLSATFPLNIIVPEGQNIYYDIAQAGSIKPGYGLSITLNYYAG